ncbi:hypothetical protein ACFE33_04735 [Falsihalocynthiibacter sp. SS001]|uniref:hypothetical protein n=1 Tax=Falsihalocynthiibacter sp. SS001 TaxID=3349698 RepID=UPI0036D3D88B
MVKLMSRINNRISKVSAISGWRKVRAAIALPLLIAGAHGANAQEDFADINNGTNPTLLTTQFGMQYQYNEINSSLNTGLFEAFYTQPFGSTGRRAFRVTVPGSDSPFNANPIYGGTPGVEFTLGDISMTYIDVFHLSEESGAAFTFELFMDTAQTDAAGYGQLAGETSLFHAWFLDNGSIFAPAWVQTFGLEGGNAQGVNVNTTTVDFYYVPKLKDPRYYMTFDPAIIHDWETDDTFGSLQVTLGMMTGKAFGGDGQFFIKPGLLFGGDRPAEWSLQAGYKVLNF